MNTNKPWYENIRKVEPYTPGEQPKIENIIKLNTNESPYPPSENIKALLKDFDYSSLRLYPSFKYDELKNILCNIYNINENQIFFGNGSDEVIALCFMTFFNSNKPIFFPDITYSFYDVWCALYNIPYKKIPLDDEFKIRTEDYTEKNGGIVIANPNAPTGRYLPLCELEEIIKANRDVIIIIDEAYIDFGGKSAIPLIKKYDNIIITQTFSKSRALAGIRIGYSICSEELVNYLEAVKNSFNSYTVSTLSQKIGAECAKDIEYFDKCRKSIIETRDNTIKNLSAIGFNTIPSKTNFIFTSNPEYKASYLFSELKKRNIIVRYFNKPRIDNYLRITIGTREQMDIFIKNIKEITNKE